MSDTYKYEGDELILFQHAINWKKYFSKQIKPFIKGNVLEVGVGIGATTQLLNDGTAKSWLMLEPDSAMANMLGEKISNKELPANVFLKKGTIDSFAEQLFDCIIYIDVLEHIEDDKGQLQKAAALLNDNGCLIVLSPAFQYLYSPFDKAIGHCRRYTKRMTIDITPEKLTLISNKYYDSMGFFAGLTNKLLLKQKYPTQKQVLFWDRWIVPISSITDKIFFHQFGKSIIAVWRKR
jgi:ubiquinone/menaquinone biosynthesis C-methylase UbiE